ncbi:signal peptidase I [Streptomyces mobaraensis NBRC 13819 = DSM 40847]|uniref:Signal peptidase I n=2 Tax=Streptomyces mobaraensis TaxID=35621 RepID=N1NV56_STRMB|nr:signal peptidase I [Streptomyces mobaraensis]EME96946.1 signal peptidase I [Streptomyces mobaraensis NBRC 13819 = DSM 40847]KAB7841597.1 signal peptidase I [Streptomyces mobaraensis]QTT72407.1 signal peptidase I [Streptomyces mobaraensis NBRC 13819 = DSM 40847]CCW72542.1 signal peptidase 5 [Streptomyces mobaraensis NBRC 13819 = DSM 40847]
MGDVAVGARSEQGGPEEEPVGAAGGTEPAGKAEQAEKTGKAKKKAGQQRPFWKELPLLVVVALVLALLIKTFLVQAFSIPSDSMQDTLQRGDRVLVDKLTPWFGSEPERGEVIVFHDPGTWLRDEPTPEPNMVQKALSFIGLMPSANEKDLIKRVIGVAGDTVECKGTGPLKVNGKPLQEPYVFPGNTPCSLAPEGQFKVTVPKDRLWVMGDHRQNSADSRFHQDEPGNGFVPVGNVVGRAIVVAWPIDRWATLPVPDTFDQKGIDKAAATAPTAVAFVGAVPLVLLRRRVAVRRAERRG